MALSRAHDHQYFDRRAWMILLVCAMLTLTNALAATEVGTEVEFLAALESTLCQYIVLTNTVALGPYTQQALNLNGPFIIARDLSITSKDPAQWMAINFDYVQAAIRLLPNATLTFKHVQLINTRQGTGADLDFMAYSPGSRIELTEASKLHDFCTPFNLTKILTNGPPPGFPDDFNTNVTVLDGWCGGPNAASVAAVGGQAGGCFSQVLLYNTYALEGGSQATAVESSAETGGYVVVRHTCYRACGQYVDNACIAQYGPTGCVLQRIAARRKEQEQAQGPDGQGAVATAAAGVPPPPQAAGPGQDQEQEQGGGGGGLSVVAVAVPLAVGVGALLLALAAVLALKGRRWAAGGCTARKPNSLREVVVVVAGGAAGAAGGPGRRAAAPAAAAARAAAGAERRGSGGGRGGGGHGHAASVEGDGGRGPSSSSCDDDSTQDSSLLVRQDSFDDIGQEGCMWENLNGGSAAGGAAQHGGGKTRDVEVEGPLGGRSKLVRRCDKTPEGRRMEFPALFYGVTAQGAKFHMEVLGMPLGSGSFATVYSGYWNSGPVAVKVLHHTAANKQRVQNEVDLMLRLDHPNVVRALHWVQKLRPNQLIAGTPQQALLPSTPGLPAAPQPTTAAERIQRRRMLLEALLGPAALAPPPAAAPTPSKAAAPPTSGLRCGSLDSPSAAAAAAAAAAATPGAGPRMLRPSGSPMRLLGLATGRQRPASYSGTGSSGLLPWGRDADGGALGQGAATFMLDAAGMQAACPLPVLAEGEREGWDSSSSALCRLKGGITPRQSDHQRRRTMEALATVTGSEVGAGRAAGQLLRPPLVPQLARLSEQQQAEAAAAAAAAPPSPGIMPTAGSNSDSSCGLMLETWIVQELCEFGSLEAAIRRGAFVKNGRPNMRLILLRLLDVALGMEYLHKNMVVHGDLKSPNVLLAAGPAMPKGAGPTHMAAKVSDFGLSRALEAGRSHHTTNTMGTVSHMPPEMLRKGRCSTAADVYAFAMIMVELVSGVTPYQQLLFSQVIDRVMAGQRPRLPAAMPAAYRRLLVACWAQRPRDRPTFSGVVCELQAMLEQASQLQAEVEALAQEAEASAARLPSGVRGNGAGSGSTPRERCAASSGNMGFGRADGTPADDGDGSSSGADSDEEVAAGSGREKAAAAVAAVAAPAATPGAQGTWCSGTEPSSSSGTAPLPLQQLSCWGSSTPADGGQ